MFNNDDWIILNKKINTLKENMSKYERENKVDKIELRECILDVLSWIEIFIKEDNFNDNSNLISGFRYVNNKKKHSRKIYDYSFITKNIYPSDDLFPSDQLFPTELNVFWCKITMEKKKKYKTRWNNYNNKLANKSVIDTIDLLLITLKDHYNIN